MLTLGVKSNLNQVTKAFDAMAKKQVPYATSLALNRCAELAKATLLTTMKSVFDRPTPFVLNSTYRSFASKSNLTVTVGHKKAGGKSFDASAYLRTEIEGGPRVQRSSERVLGSYWVPSKFMKLDQYGNVSGGQMKKLLSALKLADHTAGYTSNRSAASGARQKRRGTFQDVFVMRAGNPRRLKPGVYQRTSKGSLIPLLFFVERSPQYTARYDLYGVVRRVFAAEFDKQFAASMDYALSTAKVTIKP